MFRRDWFVAHSSVSLLILLLTGASTSSGQSVPPERPRSRPPSELTGWADWEKAEQLLQKIKVPPAPPLPPQEALKTFKIAPGYRLELVASEPMVVSPIFFEFDTEGRIWVVEYRGYMRDLQGRGEGDPICRVVVLEDLDEDGKADRSTVFADGLVMPRSLAFVDGGVLIAEPPRLWYCQDIDGDLRADRKTLVGSYGHAGNPQHTANGLRYGIDNWLHSSDSPKRHRLLAGKLIEEPTVHRGQFGVTFDDVGRFMTCYESSALHADLIPAEYLLRNPNYFKAYQRAGGDRGQFGVNVDIAREAEEIFPIRVTPAITLGALELRDDARLRTYTVVAGSCYYNGDQFPEDAYGNVFVPEAGGHLVGRLRLSGDLELKAARFYPAEQEFLASTDERFRPVNSRVGPDGALYIADMYHGIIEHVIFMVPFLERQIKERGLEEGPDMGRIYRIVSEERPIERRRPRLAKATSEQLIGCLDDTNGWRRLTAQRLLVERRDSTSIPLLSEKVLRARTPLGRLHALWVLDGLDALQWELVSKAFTDPDARVRAGAIRLSERHANRESMNRLLQEWERFANDPDPFVRLQALLLLGAFSDGRADELIERFLRENPHPLFGSAALTGLKGRELEFVTRLVSLPADSTYARDVIRLSAQAVIDEGSPSRITKLLGLLGEPTAGALWKRDVIIEAITRAIPRDLRNYRPIELEQEPAALLRLAESADETSRRRVVHLLHAFTWPGAPMLRTVSTKLRQLTIEENRLLELGKEQFTVACAPCHQPHGDGLSNVAPPLNGSEWVAGPAEQLIRIVLQGLYGPIEVNDQSWNLHMPGLGASLSDQQIAAVLTYVRRSWGNTADPVDPRSVAAVREQTRTRTLAWTAAELSASSVTESSQASRLLEPSVHGEIRLPASHATTYGRQLAYRPSLDVLAPWRHEQDVAEWRVNLPKEAIYDLFISLAADELSAGDHFLIETERDQVRGTVLSSGGYDRFREYKVGTVRLQAGVNRLLLRPDGPLKRELADVRQLRLIPTSR